jgi:hypothetical protein
MKITSATIRVALFALGLTFASAFAIDFDDCQDELDSLQRAASDASESAEVAHSKKEKYENCRRDPETFDLMQDRCRSIASDYQRAANDLASELDTVNSRIRSSASSCEYKLNTIAGSARQATRGTGDRYCDMIRDYRGKLPYDTLVKTCSNSMSADECKKCLAFKPSAQP